MLATQQQSTVTEVKNSSPQKGHFFQPKLSINQPNDVYEQEADHMADRVMRMPDPFASQDSFFKPANHTIQRKCAHCEQEDKMLHRKESSTSEVAGSSQLDSYVSSLSTAGQSLSANSRQFFEPRFGHDFSNVRIHTDQVAAKSAESINALAYTTGNNIVFNSGQYSPDSPTGQRLMAHELTHVIQQGGSAASKIQKVDKTPAAPCNLVSVVPSNDRYKFVVDTDNFEEGQQKALTDKLAITSTASPIDVLGMASAEGPEANNVTLSCKRASKVATIVRGSGHTVGLENATGGYPGSEHDKNYRAVALNIQAAPPPCVPPRAPAPGSWHGTVRIPELTDPHIHSTSTCRGACGPDCPPTCTHAPDVVVCLPDATRSCHYTFTYHDVQECGSHLGCRIHDDCYDACACVGDCYTDPCHRNCDLQCFAVYGTTQCNEWRKGNGPFDSHIQYSMPPEISAAIPGPCPP